MSEPESSAKLNQNDPPSAVLVGMRNLNTDHPPDKDPSARTSTQSQAIASLRGSVTCSIDNLNDLVDGSAVPDVYDVEDDSDVVQCGHHARLEDATEQEGTCSAEDRNSSDILKL